MINVINNKKSEPCTLIHYYSNSQQSALNKEGKVKEKI